MEGYQCGFKVDIFPVKQVYKGASCHDLKSVMSGVSQAARGKKSVVRSKVPRLCSAHKGCCIGVRLGLP